jgi:16S rRNA (cytosine967-C5)-methyltransferase
LQRVTENLARQNQPAEVICADVSNLDSWWDGQPFDRILLDAPCSGTGVIRRHPDIKWLRRKSDIDKLVVLQADILTTVWQALAAGGELLYATCSVLARENEQQINAFLASHDDASLIPINEHAEMLQKLPEPEGGDGFFYARLKKRP